MRVACVYTVDDHETIEKPLSTSSEIPFGISMIATILKERGHEIDLFVVSRVTDVE